MTSLEVRVAKKSSRKHIQESVTMALFRFTAQQGRMLFADESYVRRCLGFTDKNERAPSYRIRQALKRLEKRGLLEWRKEKTGWRSRLTPAGEKFAKRIEAAKRIQIRKPEQWDEKWRVVIFDVKEKYKSSRERFRRILGKAGLLRLQDSVWIHPYDCEELIVFIRKDLRLGGSVLYLLVEGVEGDAKLREHFELSP